MANCNNYNNCNCDCNCGLKPIVAPTKVCVSCNTQYVDQPIICPIECRRVNNVVPVPRYIPRYYYTNVSSDNNYFNQ